MIRKLKNIWHGAQALWANMVYGFPAKSMVVIGVTGTDGKTTTVTMIYHLLKSSGVKTGLISTLGVVMGDELIDSGFHVTTPDPWQVPKYLRKMRKRGITHVIIEATSNGLDQNRLAYIRFDSAVITNIREDHLDYHGSWQNYAEAKFKLVEKVKEKGLVVLNQDDEKSASWIEDRAESLKQEVFARWISKGQIKNPKMSILGIEFNYRGNHYRIPILGDHNYENTLQAICIAEKYISIQKIQDVFLSFSPPSGRMEIITSKPFGVIVDFAHTPGALERALESLNAIKQNGQRIISVFGCAGKRDKGRRKMGEVSARLADISILTAEDPRNEALEDINDDILRYAQKHPAVLIRRFPNRKLYSSARVDDLRLRVDDSLKSGEKPFFAFDENSPRSREDAIDFALALARPGDIVFITGKGHEKSLAFGVEEREYPWSDQEVVKEKLLKLSSDA